MHNILQIVAQDKLLQFLLNDHISNGNRHSYNSAINTHLIDTYPQEMEYFDEEHDLDEDEIVEDLIIIWRGFIARERCEFGWDHFQITALHHTEDSIIERFTKIRKPFFLSDEVIGSEIYGNTEEIYWGLESAEFESVIVKTDIAVLADQFEKDLEKIGHQGYIERFLRYLECNHIPYRIKNIKNKGVRVRGSLYEDMKKMLDTFLTLHGIEISNRFNSSDDTIGILIEEDLDRAGALLTGSKV